MLIAKILELANRAGKEVLNIYEKDFDVEFKNDNSPLTIADKKSHEIIVDGLRKLSKYPILSEEGKEIPYEERKNWEYYWCIDPLDGTKEFIKKNGEFTINIALIHNDEPILGVVYAPVINVLYYAKKGEGAYKNGKKLRKKSPTKPFRVVASKSHMNDETRNFIRKLGEVELVSKGSSLKLCMVADGSADIYPRIAPTMEWDTAAADAIVREVGKMTYIFDENFEIDEELNVRGTPLKYNKENLLNPYFVVV
jgi:3'(2'), 5'-bisphosphate nucleotidase